MEGIWIRSQNRDWLVFTKAIHVKQTEHGGGVLYAMLLADNLLLGRYYTVGRAKEILDEIQTTAARGTRIYEMPEA